MHRAPVARLINAAKELMAWAACGASPPTAQIPTAIGHKISRAGETEIPDDWKVAVGGKSETSRHRDDLNLAGCGTRNIARRSRSARNPLRAVPEHLGLEIRSVPHLAYFAGSAWVRYGSSRRYCAHKSPGNRHRPRITRCPWLRERGAGCALRGATQHLAAVQFPTGTMGPWPWWSWAWPWWSRSLAGPACGSCRVPWPVGPRSVSALRLRPELSRIWYLHTARDV
jgi:hypothetical protein